MEHVLSGSVVQPRTDGDGVFDLLNLGQLLSGPLKLLLDHLRSRS